MKRMRKNFGLYALIGILTVCGIITAACDNGGGSGKRKVTGVELELENFNPMDREEKHLALGVGEEHQLTYQIIPEDATNQKVTWDSDDEAVATVDANGKVTALTVGTAVITVTTEDGDHQDWCVVTVSAANPNRTLTGIAVTTPPTKRDDYKIGEPFNPAGMVVTASYDSGSPHSVEHHLLTYEYDFSEAGDTVPVTIKYLDKEAVTNVKVLNVSLTGITIVTPPDRLDYYKGDELDPAGMVVKATYSDGTTGDAIAHSELTITPPSFTTAGDAIEVTVTWGSQSATFTVVVESIEITGIAITSPPAKLKYGIGDDIELIDLTGLVVTATLSNNETEIVSNETLFDDGDLDYDFETPGTKTVTITYGGEGAAFQDSFEVTVSEKIFVDFEDAAWIGGGNAGSYANRSNISFGGYTWSISAVTSPNATDADHFIGTRSARLRGNNNPADVTNPNRIELSDFVAGIEAVSFYYGSYGTHNGGEIMLYTQIRGSDWVKVGDSIIAPAWGDSFEYAVFDVNITDPVRFKIELKTDTSNTFHSVNIDNISVFYDNSTLPNEPVTGVTLNKDTLKLDVAATETLIATVAPDYATNKAVTWESSDPTKATVSNGTVTAVAEGTTTITVKTVDGGKTATCTVTVSAIPAGMERVILDFEDDDLWNLSSYGSASEVKDAGFNWLARGWGQMDANDRRLDADGNLSPALTPANGGVGRSWRLRANNSDNDVDGGKNYIELADYVAGIKSVSFFYGSYGGHLNGVITLYSQKRGEDWVKVGEDITVPVWNADTGMIRAEFDVDINEPVRFKIEKLKATGTNHSVNIDNIAIIYDPTTVAALPVDGVELTPKTLELVAGKTGTLIPTVSPAGATNKAVTWESDDENVATVTDGVVTVKDTANVNDTATITVTTVDGSKTDSCTVTVIAGVAGGSTAELTVDFEDAAWSHNTYNTPGKSITVDGLDWLISGVSNTMIQNSDRYRDIKSIRLRGNSGDENRVELVSFLPNGIQSVSFYYGKYGNDPNANLTLFSQKDGEDWEEVGTVTTSAWSGDMEYKSFDVDITEPVRIKIQNTSNGIYGNNARANIDDIVITYYE